jgi:peptidylprolyl isomerase
MGFYTDKTLDVPIASTRLASDMLAGERPSYEYMDTGSPSFAKYLHLRANRHDDFYVQPAGGVDLCNVQVPVRKTPVSR